MVGLPNKSTIIRTVDPHECEDGHKDNIEDAKEPTGNAVLYEHTVDNDRHLPHTDNLRDRRDEKHIKSTAPTGILNKVEDNET